MKKKTIFLGGGLGNNLFQIAYGEFLTQKGYHICYKSYLTKKNIVTKLLGWSIHNNEITKQLLKNKNVSDSINLMDVLFLAFSFFKKKMTHDNLHNAPESNGRRYFGYALQGNHLHMEVLSILSQDIRKLFYDKTCQNKIDTVLHIRRGDFSKECALADDYYIEALKNLKPQGDVIVVTDEPKIIDYVKEKIFKNVKLSDGTSMLDDFFTIFNAKNVIMSNSTYCYWACVLGDVERVIYPSKISTKQDWFFSLNGISTEKINCKFLSEMERNR
ncbi:alpha-1,2-fucosyltransferase [Xenorhabdus budapestensis]|uniref:alpha-1,2-fucosyltransferase n=1 Tax=Xenorhabdus budapestensis TaxID=290110 RepID=UPI003A8AC210